MLGSSPCTPRVKCSFRERCCTKRAALGTELRLQRLLLSRQGFLALYVWIYSWPEGSRDKCKTFPKWSGRCRLVFCISALYDHYLYSGTVFLLGMRTASLSLPADQHPSIMRGSTRSSRVILYQLVVHPCKSQCSPRTYIAAVMQLTRVSARGRPGELYLLARNI